MKFTFFLAVFLSLLSKICLGQQNLFNIPSGDITNKGKAFYQHQFNVYNDKLESKAHFIYGLGKGWDAGMNLVGKGVYFSPDWRLLHNDDPKKGALYPILMGSLQKQFVLSDHIDINIGSQIGYNLSNRVQNKEINFFSIQCWCLPFYERRQSNRGWDLSNKSNVRGARKYIRDNGRI